MIVLLKICFPSFSLVMTVLKVTELAGKPGPPRPRPPAGVAGAAAAGAAALGAGCWALATEVNATNPAVVARNSRRLMGGVPAAAWFSFVGVASFITMPVIGSFIGVEVESGSQTRKPNSNFGFVLFNSGVRLSDARNEPTMVNNITMMPGTIKYL